MVCKFLGKNDIILNLPSQNKAILKRGNDARKVGFQTVYKNFRRKFIYGVAKANRPEITNRGGIINLGNESDESIVDFLIEFSFIKESQYDLREVVTNKIPRILIEFSRESIRSRGFAFWHLEKSFFDFSR